MRIVLISANDLSEDLVASWARIQQQNPALFSPFFRPEFTQAMARVRDDVFVANIEDGTAFFPFQRNILGVGRPVGGGVSDYHGLIAASDFKCDPVDLMKACRLRSWRFDHVPAEQTTFAPWRTLDTGSPVVDLGQDASPGSTALYSDHRRKRRRLERDFGPVKAELETLDPAMIELCIRWKSAQYQRIRAPDVFARPWARSLVEVIASQHKPEFAGMLSVLRAGGRPVAAHFGMRSANVWHYWFPAYDPQFQRYSPGILLLLEMMAEAHKFGIDMIDFGRGDNDYKMRISNRKIPLMEGIVVRGKLSQDLLKAKSNLKSVVKKHSTIRSVLKPIHEAYQGFYRRIRLRMYWLYIVGCYVVINDMIRA